MKYIEGERYRVLKDGARFEGLLLFGEQQISGWSRSIARGEILTCLGWREATALGTNIAGVMWTGLKVPDNAIVMQIWPFESLFRPQPQDGLLELYVDPDTLEDQKAQLPASPWLDSDAYPPPEPQLEEIDEGHVVDLTGHLPEIKAKVRHEPEGEDGILDLTGY